MAGLKCAETTLPSREVIGDADLVLVVTGKMEPSDGYAAWATACYETPETGRPIAG